MSSETLHEDAEKLGHDVIDNHRAIVSLMECCCIDICKHNGCYSNGSS